MRGTVRAGCAAMVLAVATTALADLSWQGNQWYSMGNDFQRFCWLVNTDPYDPEYVLGEYKITDVTFMFTAGASATVQAVRMQLGNSDSCLVYPNITVSIQTDDGGDPSGTLVDGCVAWTGDIGEYGVPPQNTERVYTAGTYDFPVGEAAIQNGVVYHVRMTANNIDTPGPWVGGGEEGGAVDFRLYCSDSWNEGSYAGGEFPPPEDWEWDKYMTRSYDGTIDANMYAKYWDGPDFGGRNAWGTGGDGDGLTPIGEPKEDYKLKSPLFEMFANVVDVPGTPTGYVGYDPIEGLSQGYRAGTAQPGVNDTTYTGERLPFQLHTITTDKVKIYTRKTMYGGVWDTELLEWTTLPSNPDAPLIVELQDEGGNFIAKATIDPSVLPWNEEGSGLTGSYTWVEAALTDDVGTPLSGPLELISGTKLFVKTEGLANGGYNVVCKEGTAGSIPDTPGNTYRGDDGYAVSGVLSEGIVAWTSNTNRDFLFALQMELPIMSDANMDNAVNIGDLAIVGTNYGTLTGMTWADGDFNGDGAVNIGDLAILGVHYGDHLPEPATIGLLVFGALALMRRRRFR